MFVVSDITAWLFALFVIDPLQAEISTRLERANVPVEAIQQSRQCVESHGPRLLQRAGEEPGWAVATAMGVAIGWTSPVQLLDAGDPNCSTLIRVFQINNDQDGEA
ncbi:hypothetical protein QN219_30645 [Sinorhizobium sp. 7-81]|nr:hypothetical protein [Sinorhizobium sp. 8-89]